MSSHLRFITAASLIVFGGLIGVGAVAFLPGTADRTQLANAATSDLPATSCRSWLPFDRSCLTKRDLPWTSGRTSGRGTTNSVTSAVPAETEHTAKPSATEGQRVATAPQAEPSHLAIFQPPATPPSTFQPVPQASMPETSVPQPQVLAPQPPAPQAPAPQAAQPVVPQAPAPQASTPPASPRSAFAALPQESTPQAQSPQPSTPPRVQRNNIATPAAKPPGPRPAAKERVAAKPVVNADDEDETRPAKKKSFRPERTARRSTNDALNAVRRFGDSPREIPATSYAADGSPRNIVIRPTSIQDVYYYSRQR